MNINLYTKWENTITGDQYLLVEKWGKGFEITRYKLINLVTEEEKMVDKEYMHQIIGEGKMKRILPTTTTNPPEAVPADSKP